MASNEGFHCSEIECDRDPKNEVKSEESNIAEETIYNNEEALDLAGTGRYSIGVLGMSSLSLLAMGIDLYGFSIVVAASSCEFQLDLHRKSLILTAPFIGPLIMAYPWGYLSDTQGRKKCLFFAMLGSFVVAAISAFSVGWIMLIVCKVISSAFCSCAQSIIYTWIGESCPQRVRGTYMIVASSIAVLFLLVATLIGYMTLKFQFSYDLGLISFTPWRLLVLLLALPFGIIAFGLQFYFESPKYMLKCGKESEALDILRRICLRNGGDLLKYPVRKVVLNEEGNIENYYNMPLWQSIRIHTIPLFKPPYLWRTLQLYFLMGILITCTNCLFIWFPFVTTAFYEGISSLAANGSYPQGLCNVINSSTNMTNESVTCTHTMDVKMLWISLAQGISFFIINIIISRLIRWKKTVMIVILAIASASTVGILTVSDRYNISSMLFFFGTLLNTLCIGIVYIYCVEIYPTSHRGMSSCLALLSGRICGLIGINVVGSNLITNCATTLYSIAAILFVACLTSCFLPSDQR